MIALVLFAVLPGYSQGKPGEKPAVPAKIPAPAATTAEKPGSSSAMPPLSISDLLNAAEGTHALWRPDWPAMMPPDMFVTSTPALSIIAELGDGMRLEYAKEPSGRVRAFPLLQRVTDSPDKAAPAASAAKTPAPTANAATKNAVPADATATNTPPGVVFLQGRCEYDQQGKLLKIFWKGADSEESDAEVLQWDGDNQPLLWRIWSGQYYFAAMDYAGDSLLETWYDRDGTALFVIITDKGRQITLSDSSASPQETTFYYNSWDRLSGIETPDGKSVLGLYNEWGLPSYLKTSTAAVDEQTLAFSWDGTGKLTRLTGDGQDIRYEYVLDSRGNWTTRKEYPMRALGTEDGGRLVPFGNGTINRTVRYEEGSR